MQHAIHVLPSGAKLHFHIDDSGSHPYVRIAHEGEFDSDDLSIILLAFNITLQPFDGQKVEMDTPTWIKILLDATATDNVTLIDMDDHVCDCPKCEAAREAVMQPCTCARCQAARQAQFN